MWPIYLHILEILIFRTFKSRKLKLFNVTVQSVTFQ
jgi:hypothetical protein